MSDVMDVANAWPRCQDALVVEVSRATELLRSLPVEGRPTSGGCVGGWDAHEVAVHLSQTWIAIPGLARSDLAEVEAIVPNRGAGSSVARDVSQLGQVTRAAVAAEAVRDPVQLADRIAERAAGYLRDCAGQGAVEGAELRPWLLSGVTVPPHVFTAHLLSETMVHSWDIARASGRPWRIDPDHAALVVRWFLLELLLHGGTALLPDPAALPRLAGRYRFDLRRYGSVGMVFDACGARLDDDPARPDCRMSMKPAAFLLLFFGRRGLAGTMARGGVLVGGRRPWLGARLQRSLPTP